MEDVLEVYARPYNPDYPVLCMDEKPLQLFASSRRSLHSRDGRTEYEDCDYIRNGTASIFLFTEPRGWREADTMEHRTGEDWAREVRRLLEDIYLDAVKVVLVMDNLNTHSIASLYKTFPPAQAAALARRLDIHYTPKHGSWLDIAEIELSAMAIQCLAKKRIPDLETLRSMLKPWCRDRNSRQQGVDWQFKTDQARLKLKHLYPVINF